MNRAMTHANREAKAQARRLRGIWAATLTPFRPDLALDEEDWRRNLRHWYARSASAACSSTASRASSPP
jgi:dihydrodipicolinate synthase/N-acetylneuraminate lyase